eukprot:SAG11_NODE_13_length_26388_cov_67.360341_16_plen_219_part_00
MHLPPFTRLIVLLPASSKHILALHRRAVERIESYVPENRPLPKIFRLAKKGKLDAGIFEGSVRTSFQLARRGATRTCIFCLRPGDLTPRDPAQTINTPSMLCVEDYIDALEWADSIGGLDGLIAKSKSNLAVVESFVEENEWIHFLAPAGPSRSNTSVCLTVDTSPENVKKMVGMLESEDVAYDIGAIIIIHSIHLASHGVDRSGWSVNCCVASRCIP